MNELEVRTVWIVRHIKSGGYLRDNGGIGDISIFGKQTAENFARLDGYETVKATVKIELNPS